MMKNTKLIGAIAITTAVVLLVAASTSMMTTPAFAKITPVDTQCTNSGGNQPGGQQPTCTGSGLTQESENQNPSAAAPPGQNK